MKKFFRRHQKLLIGKRRTAAANKSLGRCLAFIAGAINAGGFLVVNQYTSHMTGITSIAADSIALNQWIPAATMLFYIGCFICGAATTAMMVTWARFNHLNSQYALPITIEALLLIIFGLINASYTDYINANAVFIIALLCYLMGLQNAVITKISSTSIRTTHITGMVTDIGIEIGKILYSLKKDTHKHTQPNMDKISLHVSIVFMFLLGGVFGAYGFKYVGFLTVIPLAGYLLFMASAPIKQDLTVNKYLRKRLQRLS